MNRKLTFGKSHVATILFSSKPKHYISSGNLYNQNGLYLALFNA